MLELGVSLYPEQETKEEIESYLKLASQNGFTKVFTSLFSIDGTNEEIFNFFKELTDIAHKYQMEIYGDCNAAFITRMGATAKDLSIFKKMGIDTLRLDGTFGDQRDIELINNDLGTKVQLNASEMKYVEDILKEGADSQKITGSYNFYPLRNTGADDQSVLTVNHFFAQRNMKTQIFISSNRHGAHGPWPVSDGLPTIERDRDLPVNLQIRHMIALGVDEVIFGNAFATAEEFDEIKNIMKYIYVTTADKENYFAGHERLVPLGKITRLPLTIQLEDNLLDTEKDIIFNYDKHNVGEYNHLMIRSRWPRFVYKEKSVKPRKSDKEFFKRGDVVIINDNIQHYKGELHIVKEDIKNDGSQNLVGCIAKNELFLLDFLSPGKCFTFIIEEDIHGR